MYSLEKYVLVEEQRRIEKMAEADRYRLLKSKRHFRLAIYRRWLVSLGATLVNLGCRLQTRYNNRSAWRISSSTLNDKSRHRALRERTIHAPRIFLFELFSLSTRSLEQA